MVRSPIRGESGADVLFEVVDMVTPPAIAAFLCVRKTLKDSLTVSAFAGASPFRRNHRSEASLGWIGNKVISTETYALSVGVVKD